MEKSVKNEFEEFTELMSRVKHLRNSINSKTNSMRMKIEDNWLQNEAPDIRPIQNYMTNEQKETSICFSNMKTTSSALEQMKLLDVTLQQSVKKEKEVRKTTLTAQREILQELSMEDCVENDLVTKNTDSFRKLYSRYVNQVKETEIRSIRANLECSNIESVDKTLLELQPDEKNTDSKSEKEPHSPETKHEDKANKTTSTTEVANNRNKKPKDFITRNKELVTSSHGVGTMAITNKEKERLEELLEEIDEGNAQTVSESDNGQNREDCQGYLMSLEAKKSVCEIDSKLNLFSIEKDVCNVSSNCTSITKQEKQEDTTKIDDRRKVWQEINSQQRLIEIDRSLTSLSGINPQVVDPIDEDDIQKLINEFRKLSGSSCPSDNTPNFSSEPHLPSLLSIRETIDANNMKISTNTTSVGISPEEKEEVKPTGDNVDTSSMLQLVPTLSNEVLLELVEDARNKMPRFKFRHNPIVDG